MTRSALSTLLPLLVATAAGSTNADVLIVDAANGPGSDFAEIQPAVDAALDGDTVLVRDGVYDRVRITSKGLDLIADGTAVRIETSLGSPSIRVDGLLATQEVLVRGFEVRFGVYVDDCDGAVWFDEVHGERAVTQCSSSQHGAWLNHAQNVTFTRCTLVGSSNYGGLGGVFVGSGLLASDSTAWLFDCSLYGAIGTSQFSGTFGNGNATQGGHGVYLNRSTVTVVGCALEGGGGGIAAPVCGNNHPAGGAGAFLSGPTDVLRSAASTAVGGQTDLDALCPGLLGPAGLAVEGPGTVVGLPGFARSLRNDGPVRGNGTLTFTLEAQPGELPLLLVSDVHAPVAVSNGALLVGLPPVDVLVLPTMPASGTSSWSLAVPNVGPLVGSVCLYAQSVFLDAATQVWTGAATPVVLLDASY